MLKESSASLQRKSMQTNMHFSTQFALTASESVVFPLYPLYSKLVLPPHRPEQTPKRISFAFKYRFAVAEDLTLKVDTAAL